MASVSCVSSPEREIAPGIWWLPVCLVMDIDGQMTHVHNAPYLIVGSEKTLLWDTAGPVELPGVDRSLGALLGDRRLDYVIPSHPEVAHCGNVQRLMAKYPEAQLVGDIRDYPFFFPELADRMVALPAGSEIDLGDRKFVLVDALIKDLPSSQWGYEATQQVLFVADAFAYSHHTPIEGDDRPTHAPGECSRVAGELGKPPAEDQIVWITKAALYWTRFVPLAGFRDALEEALREYPPKVIAPAHGAVIDDVDLVWVIWDALRHSYDPKLGVQQAGAAIGKWDPSVNRKADPSPRRDQGDGG